MGEVAFISVDHMIINLSTYTISITSHKRMSTYKLIPSAPYNVV